MAVILIPPNTGAGEDHDLLIHLDRDTHLQYLTQARGDARVKVGLMSLLSGTVVKAHPNYVDNPDLLQYSTISAALVKAATLVAPNFLVAVEVMPGVHPVVDTLVIPNGVALVFPQTQALLDLSGWTGAAGNPLFDLSGISILVNPFLWNIGVAPHPFTGYSWIKVNPSALSWIVGMQMWDLQGGATIGVDVQDGATATLEGGMYSMVTSGYAVRATGGSSLVVDVGTHVVALFGTCIKCLDNVGLVGPSLSLYSTYLNNLGTPLNLIDISPNTSIGPEAFKGSFFDLAKTNIPRGTYPIDTMLNSKEILQLEWPDASKPDPEAYSLKSGLALAKIQVLDRVYGHRHSGIDDGAPVSYLMNYYADRASMVAGSRVYFARMNSSNGVKVSRTGKLVGVGFTNDNVLTRDLKIWQFEEPATLTLIATVSLVGQRYVDYVLPVGAGLDAGDHLIAALEPGTGAASNANLVMTTATGS